MRRLVQIELKFFAHIRRIDANCPVLARGSCNKGLAVNRYWQNEAIIIISMLAYYVDPSRRAKYSGSRSEFFSEALPQLIHVQVMIMIHYDVVHSS
jgi:hypothetical protein